MNAIDFSTQHRRTLWLGCVALLVAVLIFWMTDRDLPGVPDMTGYVAPRVVAGHEASFTVILRRDLRRRCSLTISRSILDSTGALRPYGNEQRLTWAGLVRREQMSPGRLRQTLPIPSTLPVGASYFLTENSYRCPTNPTTWLFPIETSMVWPFETLPPAGKAAP